MALKSFLIGPQTEGQVNNVKPFFIPEEAYSNLEDAYVWRGRVKKRYGYSLIGATDLLSRLRINIGTTDAITGNFSTIVPGAIFKIGQMFSIGTTIFTVKTAGAAALLSTGTATGTYNTATGALAITGNAENPSTAVYFYPADTVMGLRTLEKTDINNEELIAFDTQFSYQRSGGGWVRFGTVTWSGSNSNFFWTTNYRGASPYENFFYVTNNNATDTIWYYNSTTGLFANLLPQLDSGVGTRFLRTSRILIGFKDRLIALNTVERESGIDRNYYQRARFSQNGDPTNNSNSWLDTVAGRGGYIDAPTSEQIITCEILKDRLIVYFERSTWELVYTGVSALPFRWQVLNNELGCESTFSVIGFDSAALGVGNVGVHSCNGVNVARIDEKIPNEVFKIHNGNDGPERVYGIRDYVNELVYWTFPDAVLDNTFPTRVLIYNYINHTWAFCNDSFTCFGYFQRTTDLTWATLPFKTWAEWNTPWGSPLFQSSFPLVSAGNQQGFVLILENDSSANSQSLYITDMVTGSSSLVVVDHNLKSGDYILIENAAGITSLNDSIFKIQSITDEDTFVIDTTFSGTYSGNGKITRINNLNISTKQFNPGTPVGQQFRLAYVDLLLNRTVEGEVCLNYLVDTTLGESIQDQVTSDVLLGSNILYTRPEDGQTYQAIQNQIWHRYYVQSQGQFIQLHFFLNDDQMRDKTVAQSEFELHAMLLYVEPQGRLIG